MVHIAFSITTGDKHFTHVTHIEHTARLTYSLMLINNATILYRHVETSKG